MPPYTKGRLRLYSFKWGPSMDYEGPFPRIMTVSISVTILLFGISAVIVSVSQLIKAIH